MRGGGRYKNDLLVCEFTTHDCLIFEMGTHSYNQNTVIFIKGNELENVHLSWLQWVKTHYKEEGSGDRQWVGLISWYAAVTSMILFVQPYSPIGPWEMGPEFLRFISRMDISGPSRAIALRWIRQHPISVYLVNIGLGRGLVPSGSKPLPGPMLIHIYVAIGRHWATK